jgi:hypothetical protein
MKIALCTTTIHIPHALKLLRKCSAEVKFFVATDEKTPEEISGLGIANTVFVRAGNYGDWKCSEAIGWNTLARRNIAFLEALKWGADIIYSWDDDNIPTSSYHFVPFDGPWAFDGIDVGAPDWFDPGFLLIPRTRHRGIPYGRLDAPRIGTVTGVKIGVMAGLVIGDPDVDATTRMELRPDIGQVHLLGQAGVIVDPNTWTVFNSQNTAVIRELIPAWFMMPGAGRHDDIYASLIVQRVARERGYHVHFGPPFTYQQRNQHNLVTDLRSEIDGMENVSWIAEGLDSIRIPADTVVNAVRHIYGNLIALKRIPEQSFVAAMAWLEDVEGLGL